MAAVWSHEEKRKLLHGLHQYGPRNLDALHKLLPNKTKLEIMVFCEEHARMALVKQQKTKSPAVKQWLQVLKRLNERGTDQFHDTVPRVLKYISLFEKRVPTKSINISDCYMYLSRMCRGLEPAKLDENAEYFMYECLTKLAKYLKYGGECRTYRNLIGSINHLKDLHLHRQNADSYIEQSLSLNPLGIPEHMLDFKNVDVFQK